MSGGIQVAVIFRRNALSTRHLYWTAATGVREPLLELNPPALQSRLEYGKAGDIVAFGGGVWASKRSSVRHRNRSDGAA